MPLAIRADPAATEIGKQGAGARRCLGGRALDRLEETALPPDQGVTAAGTLGSNLSTAILVTNHRKGMLLHLEERKPTDSGCRFPADFHLLNYPWINCPYSMSYYWRRDGDAFTLGAATGP
jgi:hypothetical protein